MKILYAREFGVNLPKIDSEVIVCHRAGTAVEKINDLGESIDAYILGIVMLKEHSCLARVEKMCAAQNLAGLKWLGEGCEENKTSWVNLTRQISNQMDYTGGLKVFQHLLNHNYVKDKKVLFYTEQTHRVPSRSNQLCQVSYPGDGILYTWLSHL